MVTQGVNPLVETAVAVMEIAEADGTDDGVSVETEADETDDAVSVETEADEIIDVIQDVDVIQGVTDRTEVMTKSVQRNAIERPAENAPDMHTIEGRNQYDLGDTREEIETIEVKT